jgi:hypothetical protein
MPKAPEEFVSHWNGMVEGLHISPLEFYGAVEQAIERWQIPDTRRERVDWREGGLLSAKREYLRVRRGEYVFDICAAPFGAGFFVSWWLGEFKGCVTAFPFLNFLFRWLVKPKTYYAIDTAYMFKGAVHACVTNVLNEFTTAKGLRALSELDRKPVDRDVFAH